MDNDFINCMDSRQAERMRDHLSLDLVATIAPGSGGFRGLVGTLVDRIVLLEVRICVWVLRMSTRQVRSDIAYREQCLQYI